MILSVPVKPHVQQFFHSASMFGTDPIVVRRNHYLGELICAVLAHYPLEEFDLDQLTPSDQKRQEGKLTLDLTFQVNSSLITDFHLRQLAISLEVLFDVYAQGFVNGRMDVFASLNGASIRFCEKHEIRIDDYTPDSLRKVVTRNRIKTRTTADVKPALTA